MRQISIVRKEEGEGHCTRSTYHSAHLGVCAANLHQVAVLDFHLMGSLLQPCHLRFPLFDILLTQPACTSNAATPADMLKQPVWQL